MIKSMSSLPFDSYRPIGSNALNAFDNSTEPMAEGRTAAQSLENRPEDAPGARRVTTIEFRWCPPF
eukprot:SAG11_NODE_186_length_13142_cov_17.515679_11_plen_66_part_00